jgi:choline dehydrogenase-like flavoprotein
VGAALQERVEAAANVTVVLHATATGLERAGDGRRVARVHVAASDGTSVALEARFVILAAGGVENARLLLASGLGNDWTGRCFMEHPHVVVGRLRAESRSVLAPCLEHDAAAPGHREMLAVGLPERLQREHRLLNASVQVWPETEAGEGPLVARLLLRSEQAPNPESRVGVAAGQAWAGLDVAQLDWTLTASDWSSIARTAELVGAALARLPGVFVALEHLAAPWPDFPPNPDHYCGWGGHHIGTTRMAASPDTGVVDRDARVFGLDNLFVAGSSLFPTSGYANPTLLLVSLALRTASRLGECLGR